MSGCLGPWGVSGTVLAWRSFSAAATFRASVVLPGAGSQNDVFGLNGHGGGQEEAQREYLSPVYPIWLSRDVALAGFVHKCLLENMSFNRDVMGRFLRTPGFLDQLLYLLLHIRKSRNIPTRES